MFIILSWVPVPSNSIHLVSPAGRLSAVEEYFCALASFLLSSTGVFVVISHQECNLFKLPFDLTNHTIFSVNHIQVFFFFLFYVRVYIRSISQETKAFYFEVHHSTLKGQWERGKGIVEHMVSYEFSSSLFKTVILFSWKNSFFSFLLAKLMLKSGQESSKGIMREGIQSRMRAFSLLLKEKYCTWIFWAMQTYS